MKYHLPFIMTFFCLAMVYSKFIVGRLVLVFPIMFAATFLFTLARLEVSDGVLRYKRFRRWTPIDPTTVQDSGVIWPGLIGYIRLIDPVNPWRRLYFVLDEQPGQNPFSRSDSVILAYIRHQGNSKKHAPSNSVPIRLLIVGLVGAISFLLMRSLLPPLLLPSGAMGPAKTNLRFSTWITAERGITSLLNSYPLAVAYCATFLFVAIYRRRSPDAWTFALLAGTTSAAVLAHFL